MARMRQLVVPTTIAVMVGVAVPAPVPAAQYFPALVAGAVAENGQSFGASLRLPLRRVDFQLVRRSSRSSITLGYPATERAIRHGRAVRVRARPCAIVSYHLAIAAGTADPLARVRVAVPDAGSEGTERRVIIGQPVDITGPPRRAWRIAAAFSAAGLLSERGTSIEQLLPSDPFGPPVSALRTITMRARMLHHGGACGGSDSFTLGPGVDAPVRLG
jgi:hypothetical protein